MQDKLSRDLSSLRIDRSRKEGDPKRVNGWWAGLLILLLLILIAGFVFFRDQVGFSGLVSKPTVVEVVRVVRQLPSNQGVLLTAGGYIVPRRRVEVSSKISGRVAKLLVDKGDEVRKGQVLATLDARETVAQLEQARATRVVAEARLRELEAGSRPQEIQRAQASLEEAEARVRTATISLERAQELHRTGVYAKQALDEARNDFEVAEAQTRVARENLELARLGPRKEQIETARAQVRESEATIRLWQTQLEEMTIRAPVAGTVLERLIEEGEMVTTGYVSGRGAKSALVSIADLGELEVELDINESDIPKVRHGQECLVSPDSYPDRKYRGAVREIAPEANRQKATIQVKVSISAPDAYLRPETNAKVHFLEGSAHPSAAVQILIPKSAIREESGASVVFLVQDGRAVKRQIEAGETLLDQRVVLSGLSGGEQLIVRGMEELADGQRIHLKEP